MSQDLVGYFKLLRNDVVYILPGVVFILNSVVLTVLDTSAIASFISIPETNMVDGFVDLVTVVLDVHFSIFVFV